MEVDPQCTKCMLLQNVAKKVPELLKTIGLMDQDVTLRTHEWQGQSPYFETGQAIYYRDAKTYKVHINKEERGMENYKWDTVIQYNKEPHEECRNCKMMIRIPTPSPVQGNDIPTHITTALKHCWAYLRDIKHRGTITLYEFSHVSGRRTFKITLALGPHDPPFTMETCLGGTALTPSGPDTEWRSKNNPWVHMVIPNGFEWEE